MRRNEEELRLHDIVISPPRIAPICGGEATGAGGSFADDGESQVGWWW
jgi:hypothetical protein